MISLFDKFFRYILKSDDDWNQIKNRIHKDIGITHSQMISWKPYTIEEVNFEEKKLVLKSENKKQIKIPLDDKTMNLLTEALVKNQFLSKYNKQFYNEIKYWNFSYSKSKPPEFFIYLWTKIKPEYQTSSKRKKMYNKRKIVISKKFINDYTKRTTFKK